MPTRGHLAPHTCSLHAIRTVLIGSSLDQGSDEVVRAGLALARAAGARVCLVSAADYEPPVPAVEHAVTDATHQEQVAWQERELAKQVQRIGIGELELADARVAVGPPHRVLIDAARETGAELIVVGATRGDGPAGKLLGSTADRVLRKAVCPVLIVRGELRVPPRRVLVPVDLSPLAGDAFHCGLHFLTQIAAEQEVEVEALYAVSFLENLAYRHQAASPAAATPEEILRRVEADLADFLRDSQVDSDVVESRVVSGDPRVEILAELERRPADLVILGTHGRGGFDRFLLGSVASALAREAPCSLLLVPPEAALAEALADAIVAQTTPAWHLDAEGHPVRETARETVESGAER